MFAIVTKYHGPTYSKGSRISATGSEKRVYAPYGYNKSGVDLHIAALVRFLNEYKEFFRLSEAEMNPANWVSGEIEHGYTFVFVGKAG